MEIYRKIRQNNLAIQLSEKEIIPSSSNKTKKKMKRLHGFVKRKRENGKTRDGGVEKRESREMGR
ncbi:MAG: hypothetical protein ABI855_07025 [Bacteroidota bacterium]